MQDEVKSFEEVRFVLNKWQPIFPQNIFRGENYIPINREMLWPITRNGKVVCQIVPFKMSNLRYNQWEVGQFLEEIINPPFGGSPSQIWMNQQDYISPKSKQEAI